MFIRNCTKLLNPATTRIPTQVPTFLPHHHSSPQFHHSQPFPNFQNFQRRSLQHTTRYHFMGQSKFDSKKNYYQILGVSKDAS